LQNLTHTTLGWKKTNFRKYKKHPGSSYRRLGARVQPYPGTLEIFKAGILVAYRLRIGCGSCVILPRYAALCRAISCKLNRINTWLKTGSQEVTGSIPVSSTKIQKIALWHSFLVPGEASFSFIVTINSLNRSTCDSEIVQLKAKSDPNLPLSLSR
jgi:hypothetical protein